MQLKLPLLQGLKRQFIQKITPLKSTESQRLPTLVNATVLHHLRRLLVLVSYLPPPPLPSSGQQLARYLVGEKISGDFRGQKMEILLNQPAIAVLISTAIAGRAYKKKSLDLSGAFMGFLVMSIHIAVNYRHFIYLFLSRHYIPICYMTFR